MFTGIVTAVGRVRSRESTGADLRLTIEAPFTGLELGESIAVNGACLTVVDRGDGWFAVDAVATTRARTTLGETAVGRRVNLERALALGERLGGHLVQGHVDGVGDVIGVAERDDVALVNIRVPPEIDQISVPHGSITVDGVSMTVNALPEAGVVQISLIPYTREHTTLGALAPGDRVHLEGDLIGKFVRRLVEARDDTADCTPPHDGNID